MADEPTPQEIQSLDENLADPETAYDIDDIAEGLEQSEESIDDFFREQEELLRTETARALEEQQIFLEEQENASDTTEITDTRMSRWLDHARTDHQAQGMAVAVKQEDRKDLTADALIKLQKATTEGMTHKFSLMSHNSDDQLVDCYNLTLRVEELKSRLKETDTIGGFDIFDTIIITPIDPMPDDVRLIEKVDTMTEPLVRASMKFKRYYGQTYDVQNLQWSQELIKNSCDEDLATKVMERLRKIPDEEKGGALFYFIMIKLIQTNTEQAVRVLTEKLEKLSLRTLTGENVYTACSLIRGVVERLDVVNKIPHDIENTILKILQTSSVDKFNKTFETLEESRFLGLVPKKEIEDILILAELRYTSILSDEGWSGLGRVGKSTFTMNADGTLQIGKSTFLIGDDGEIIPPSSGTPPAGTSDQHDCWSCGQPGHLSWQCPNRGSPVGGRGRGGRGRGQERSDPQNPKRIPPKAGEPHEKVVKGVPLYWCNVCNSWNGTHLTVDHVTKKQQQANLSEDAANNPDQEATCSTPPEKKSVSFYSSVARQMAGGRG